MLQFPLAWVLSNNTSLGEVGIWIAYPVQNIITAAIAAIWFARGTWKRQRVMDEPEPERAVSTYRPGAITTTTLR